MNNQIIELPATTFTGLANYFKGLHPEGIKGAVDVHSPDFYEGAKRFAYIEGDSDGGRVTAVWSILPTREIATLVKNPGAVVPLDDVFASIHYHGASGFSPYTLTTGLFPLHGCNGTIHKPLPHGIMNATAALVLRFSSTATI